MPSDLTVLLQRAQAGEKAAGLEVYSVVYPKLREIAAHHLRKERPWHTLQATALVNEAYIKLVNQNKAKIQSRNHFFAIASKAIRRILIDYGRHDGAQKRGGGAIHVPLEEELVVGGPATSELLLAVDQALERLAAEHPLAAKVIELHRFASFTYEETAERIGVSVRTAKRYDRLGQAFLRGELGWGDSDDRRTESGR